MDTPIANAFIESWIGNLKRECLNHFFCFDLRQLDHIVQTYARYYNEYRPHQGLGNKPLDTRKDLPLQTTKAKPGSIQCQRWLGGLLKHYYREAA